MELHLGGDEGGGELGVCCCACTTAANIVGDVVDLKRSRLLSPAKARGGRTFSQFLSATMSPSVARVSAPKTIPSLKRHPTMVVPVLVALGRGMPRSARKLFL